jgi:hypothetical protein
MNADPGVISARGSEGRGRGKGEDRVYDFGTHVKGSHDGKTSKVRNYAEIEFVNILKAVAPLQNNLSTSLRVVVLSRRIVSRC